MGRDSGTGQDQSHGDGGQPNEDVATQGIDVEVFKESQDPGDVHYA